MVKAIIFDFWGTIVENGIYPSPTKQVKYILRLDMPYSPFVMRFEKHFMLKKFNDLFEGFTEVCKAFNIEADQNTLEKLVGMWNKNKLLAKLYPETIKVLEDLKKDYKLVLLSNCDSSIEQVLEKYNLKPYFDIIYLSYEKGKLKTDKGVFEEIAKSLKLKTKDLIMVGDSIETDIKPAEEAGVKAFLVDRRNRMEHANKILTLSELRGRLNE